MSPTPGKRPNILILMTDEMRYRRSINLNPSRTFVAPVSELENLLRQRDIDFRRHYAASVACVPSRASLYTGHYPSLHGDADHGRREGPSDPNVFWLEPGGVPTLGDYFGLRIRTYWRGKWRTSDADLVVPGTTSAR